MRLYIAGKNLGRANRAAGLLEQSGHTIPCNWYHNYKDDQSNFSPSDELAAIREADALIYLWESDQESARYEAGAALGLGKPIIIVHKSPTWFMALPNVYQVDSDEEIVNMLSNLTEDNEYV